MKTAILGVGGVGATVAAALEKDSENLILIARGQTKETIKKQGLLVKSDVMGERIVHAGLVSDNTEEIGVVDVLFICCKTYSLEEVCGRYSNIVGENTLVIPLQNGITAAKDIASYLNGKGNVANGYIYCFSNITEPGIVVNAGKMLRLGFGTSKPCKNAEKIADALNKGGLETVYDSDSVKTEIWEKYIMMCGNSCALIYYDCDMGGIQKDSARLGFLREIYNDIKRMADAAGVMVDSEIADKYIKTFMSNPPQSMTSMYRDIKDGKNENEFEAVVGNGYRLAKELGVNTPYIDRVYEKVKNK